MSGGGSGFGIGETDKDMATLSSTPEPQTPNPVSYPSPNFDTRAAAPQFIVLHYTGMPTGEEALARLCDPAAKVSAHYLIEEDGRVFALVDEKHRAWHAGKSFWRGATDLNSASLGIELVNPGHQFGYRPFPPAQIAAASELMRDIIKRHGMNSALCALGHSDVAPERKQDPGELFPWRQLAQDGIGLWPEPQAPDYEPVNNDEVQKLLGIIGYGPQSQSALLAFQRRYHPENLTGAPDRETAARLRALARMIDALGDQ